MARRITQRFLVLQITLYLFLIFVRGNEDAEDEYKNGRNLVLEYFLPINLPARANVPFRREKRDVEGSGEDDPIFREKTVHDAENATFVFDDQKSVGDLTEGSGEVVEESDSLEEEKNEITVVPLMTESEFLTTTLTDEVVKITGNRSVEIAEPSLTSTEMIFDKSEDFDDVSTIKTEETSAVNEFTPTVILINTTEFNAEGLETTTAGNTQEENTTENAESRQNESTTPTFEETTTSNPQTTTEEVKEETTTLAMTVVPHVEDIQTTKFNETTTLPPTTRVLPEETTTLPPLLRTLIPILVPQTNVSEETTKHELDTRQEIPSTLTTITTPVTKEELPVSAIPPTTPEPVVEEVFKETKIEKKLEVLPENVLQKENLTLAADPLLVANTRLMDSEENVHLSSSEPKRLGAYIVIGLILLSFSSLVGYITFKKRMNRKRLEFESHQESNDTEKALLSLSDYKDNSELEENHLKNNEITPIVVKSNSQINKFEKNTNFSSPKNLNTIANEKNIEKDNVLKSTAENLTQVIIEDSPKDVEEDKNVPSVEKLIVKTRIDQDSIPKKPIIINRSSTGYLPIPQDNS